MFAKTLSAAFEAATPEACRSLLAQGVTHVVAVENSKGEWFLAHATSVDHGHTLARSWVDKMDARGASVWRLHEDGPAKRHCGLVTPEPEGWE